MSLITLEQFEQLKDDYPELAQYYTFITLEQFEQLSEDYPELAQCYPVLQIKNTFNKNAETGWDNFEEDWRTHA